MDLKSLVKNYISAVKRHAIAAEDQAKFRAQLLEMQHNISEDDINFISFSLAQRVINIGADKEAADDELNQASFQLQDTQLRLLSALKFIKYVPVIVDLDNGETFLIEPVKIGDTYAIKFTNRSNKTGNS
ncbi:hypothetical protein GCM10023149_37350 [Mucilaginibacter gynuensis]|uniref:Uncharacterized protein n=1 Tax=Mucilaginibacter gynuensis TaxID=1302236 RepID=A0ABP8GXR1_9SPHI